MTIVEALDETRDETLRYFLREPELARSYGPGKWSVRHILHHLADSELVLLERIRRILSEGRRALWAFDQDAWAKGLDYSASLWSSPVTCIPRRGPQFASMPRAHTRPMAIWSGSTAKPGSGP